MDYRFDGFWHLRPETVSSCAQQTVAFLKDLKNIDPLFHEWTVIRKHEVQPLSIDEMTLRKLFANRRTRDEKGRVIAAIGYSLTLWTPDTVAGQATLRLRLGSVHPQFRNSCQLILRTGLQKRVPFQPAKLAMILIHMAARWRIGQGYCIPQDLDRSDPTIRSSLEAGIGWISFLPHPVSQLSALPHPAYAHPLPFGTLLFAVPTLFDPHHEGHLAALRTLYEALSAKGLVSTRA